MSDSKPAERFEAPGAPVFDRPGSGDYDRGAAQSGRRVRSGGVLDSQGNDADAELIRSVANGDRVALAQLYDRFAPILMAVATRILGERREAEDLLHDVFLEVWRQAADYDVARGSVRAWIMIRLRSRAIDRRKSAAVARAVPLEPEEHIDERGAADEDPQLGPDRASVRRALAALPDEQRTVLELGYFEGLSSSEIAARIDAPVGTVKSRVAAALAKLRAAMLEPARVAR